MATPTGPCLSPWRYSLPHSVFSLKKRKTAELQNIQSTAKRRCFPSTESLSTCKQETDCRSGKLSSQSEVRLPWQPKTVVDCQPIWCAGHDSLLHDSYSEADPVSYQPCPTKNSGDNFMTHNIIQRSRVADDLNMDLDESAAASVTARSSKGGREDQTAKGSREKCSLQKRAEQLEIVIQFMKDNDICSNDYWAIPSAQSMEEELESAHIAMETDCVPNADQYRCYSNSNDIFREKPSCETDQPHFF